ASGGLGSAASGELVHRLGLVGLELHKARLDLAQYLADRNAEDALATVHEVDDLVIRSAEVDACAVTHEGRLGEIVDARLTKLVDSRADLLQRDARVEKSLDELEHEDVAETIEALRPRTGGTTNGRLHELGAGPVVELAVADSGGASRDGTAIAGGVVEVGQAIGEEESEVVARLFVPIAEFAHLAVPSTMGLECLMPPSRRQI